MVVVATVANLLANATSCLPFDSLPSQSLYITFILGTPLGLQACVLEIRGDVVVRVRCDSQLALPIPNALISSFISTYTLASLMLMSFHR